MVETTDLISEIDCELHLGEEHDPYECTLVLTEDGVPSIKLEKGTGPQSKLEETWAEINGRDKYGRNISVKNANSVHSSDFQLTKISTPEVTISKNKDHVLEEDREIVIEFDVLCFQPNIPASNQLDEETRQHLMKNSGVDSVDEYSTTYVDKTNLKIEGVPLTDTKERVEFIEDNHQNLRTAKIRVTQIENGPISRRVDLAKQEVKKVIEVSQLVQETSPTIVRTKVISVDGTPIQESNVHYEKFYSGGTANTGGAFKQFPERICRGDFGEFVEEAYDNYDEYTRKQLRVQQALGYYVDARDSDRSVEPKLLSTCSAIEILSLWHAREDNESCSTGEKIQHTINKLEVETQDLAQEVIDKPNELDYPEYFWSEGRNHVVHGDPDVSTHDLFQHQEAALIVLKRLLRNQLLGKENDKLEGFYDLEMRSIMSFDE